MAILKDLIIKGAARFIGDVIFNNSITAGTIKKNGGTSSQFLKADGSIDSNTYLTSHQSLAGYLPLSGGTMTGSIKMGTSPFWIRSNSVDSYNMAIYPECYGNDSMTFINDNAVTSFTFVQGQKISGWSNGAWNNIIPAMQIKQNSVYINEVIKNGVTPSYKFLVNGITRLSGNGFAEQLDIYRNANGAYSVINFYNKDGLLGYIGMHNNGSPLFRTASGTDNVIIHSGNIGSQSVAYATSAGYADSAGSADKVDDFHITSWGYPYKKSGSCKTTTTLKDLYVTIQLSGYAGWNSLGIECGYNNAWHKLRIYKVGFSDGIVVIPSNQNGGVFGQICYDSVYHSTTHKATIYLKMKAIQDSTTSHYSPSSEATVYVYALEDPTVTISQTTPTLSANKAWSDITANVLVTNSVAASVTYAGSAGSVAWTNVSGRPTKVSQLTNDSGYLTSHQSLSSYLKFEMSSSTLNDCNAVDRTGIWTHSGFSNRPSGVSNWGNLFNIRLYSDNNLYHRQLFFDCYGTDKIWTRSDNGGSWTSWKQVAYTDSNITGTAAGITGKTFVTASSKTTSNWSTYASDHIPTMSFIAYWNGAYSGTSSNLTYSANGTILGTSNYSSYALPLSGGWMNKEAVICFRNPNDGGTSPFAAIGYQTGVTGTMHANNAYQKNGAFYIWSNGSTSANDNGGLAIDNEGVTVFGAGDSADNFTGVFRVLNEDNVADGPQLLVTKASGTAIKHGLTVDGTAVVLTNDSRLSNARPANGGNADTVDSLHGSDFMRKISPGVSTLQNAGYLASDYTSRYGTEEFLKALCKWLEKNYAGSTVTGMISPNSRGFYSADVYGSGFNADTGFPQHVTIHYYPHGGSIINCGTSYGNWYYNTVAKSGDAQPASDVYAWAKAATKPTYTASEVGLGNVTNQGANYYTQVYNSADIGSSGSVTFTNLAAKGNSSVGMIYAATDNPRGAAGWCHCWSQAWSSGVTSSWVSQIALGTDYSEGGMWYRTTSGNIAGKAWTRVLDSSNWSSYCAAASHTHSYLPLAGGDMTGCVNWGGNKVAINWRTGNTSYNSKVEYMTSGNEALVFANQSAVTSFMFYTGLNIADDSTWYNKGNPALQIKQNCVYVNQLINNGVTPGYNFYVNGTSYMSGNVTSGGAYYANSDIRYKNIQTYKNYSIQSLGNLPIFTYYWKDRDDQKIHVGSSAQAVETIIPELVTADESGFKSLDYSILGAITGITACRELLSQKSEIEQLKAKIKELESKLDNLKNN